MATVAEFTVGSAAFPLGSILGRWPDATAELERVVPTGSALVPYVWVRGIEPGDVASAVDDRSGFGGRSGVRSITHVDQVDGTHLLRVEWDPGVGGILTAIAETDITLLRALGTGGEWRFEVRAEEADAIGEFQTRCREEGVPVKLTGLHALAGADHEDAHGLTDPQREALILAYERGYYESPREATLAEIAEELGITGQSLGSRLRRGIRRLIGGTLVQP